jgi:uncharacterized protein YcnI
MRKKILPIALFVLAAVTSLSAHIMVSPLQSKAGTLQKYELRVHNEGKIAASAVDLEIPDGVTVAEVIKPAAGTFTTKKVGDRITAITWQVEVAPSKYVALPFTATNPSSATELHWNMREHLADGSTIDWSDKPGAKQKGSITKLTATVRNP